MFVDASREPAPGLVTARPVVAGHTVPGGGAASQTHHLTPEALVTLAEMLYGGAPAVTLVSIGIESTELADTLSPAVEAALPEALERVLAALGLIGAA